MQSDVFDRSQVQFDDSTSQICPLLQAVPAGASNGNGVRNEESQNRESGKGADAKQTPAKLPMVPRVLRQVGGKAAPAAGES